ncbi:MAG: insulinase family protein [Acidimicrobiia bacterium]|nr:insulinase family protein [Acidimicrobiia bacterium]
MAHYRLSTLGNGLRLITEEMPALRSVSVGCWVDTGARDERPNEAGASHFLEHLLFKGTEELSARRIAETFDGMGAESNAFTSKEQTCYWARLLDEDLPVGMRLLSEMLQRPAFRQNEIDSERQVVFEEINMREDDPQDSAFEAFSRTVHDGHALGRPVLGTRESIGAMTRADLDGYWRRRYGPDSMVVALAGAVRHSEARELVEELFGEWSGGEVGHSFSSNSPSASVGLVERDTEQAHLVLGGSGMDRSDERRWAFGILNLVLGGGMSSRLFTSIREERGLAYSIFSFSHSYADSGVWGIYVGTTPRQTAEVMELIDRQLSRIMDEGITDAELEKARGAARGALAMAMEDSQSRMVHLGRDEICGLEHYSMDERLGRILAVERSDVTEVARQLFSGPKTLGVVGPFAESDVAGYVT